MNEKNLVICDREFRYANNLAMNIARDSNWAVRVCVCTGIEHALNFRKTNDVHILIVDESYPYSERQSVMAEQTFVLCKGQVADLGKEECEIGKFRCADDIIKDIFEIYTEHTEENLMSLGRKRGAKLIAVYSPIHRIGKTTFARAIGREYAKQWQTLYINMEEYPALGEKDEEGINLGDLLYYAKQGSSNFAAKIRAGAKTVDGMDYLLPIPVLLDLKEISCEEWELLLEQIVKNSAYERIVLDLGESIQGLFRILEMCNRVYMPILRDPVSEQKVKCYDRNVEYLKLEKLPKITHRFAMPENIEEYAKLRVKEEGECRT